MLGFERSVWLDNPRTRIAGIDEAGRGPLAGPVMAAAVVMDPEVAESMISGPLEKLTDSKQLTENERETFFGIITSTRGILYGVGAATSGEIDLLNIRRATFLAMKRAVLALPCGLPDLAFVDGLPVSGLPIPSKAIVKGDSLSFLIAAASVVAKVTRDHLMVKMDAEYPQYGFAKHKGYGTPAHLKALAEFGPCPIHRRGFAPVAAALQSVIKF